jgi:hypothetical protein
MKLHSVFRRAPRRGQSRGQMIILGAVSLLVLALIVFITFNVTVAVQQRIKLQNYADAKAFSMAVAEARTLNYMAYTNRAIASAYVGMSNVHAYMSEAAMLADLKLGGATIMGAIAGQEYSLCMCCCTPFGCAPCCFNHCIDAFEAGMNAVGLTIDWISGDMQGKLSQLDGPATNAVNALNNHINMMQASQTAAKVAVAALLTGGTFGTLKQDNMQLAENVTQDEALLNAANLQQWNRVFNGNTNQKKQIMTEVVNASRQDFAWNRSGPMGAPITPMLFPQLSQRVKSSTIWMGPTGMWTITQTPDVGFLAGGRTGAAANAFNMGFTGDVSNNQAGAMVTSFDWGMLAGQWKHGASTSTLPILGPISPGNLSTGQSGNTHSGGFLGDIFNNPHNGSNHAQNLDFSRFQEFNPSGSFPFNQPYVYAGATTDTRVNEYGQRGPWEVAKDGSGTITVTNVGPQDAKLTLSNNNRARAFAKAMVYYHRIGDWTDYPNLFNPFWRAKLQPLTTAEVGTVLVSVDSQAATVVGGSMGINKGAVNVD